MLPRALLDVAMHGVACSAKCLIAYDSHELDSWVREFGNQIVPTQNPYFQACWPPEAASKLENRGKARGWLPNFASCQASWQESDISRLVGYKKAGSLCHNEEPTVIFRSMLSAA